MSLWACRICIASLVGSLWTVAVEAAEFKRFDGVHRIEKKAQITAHAVLGRRDDVCETGLKLCPSSLSGGCCPENYDCAKESCYATTRGPATCGTLVGWHACEGKYGGGCCPDGYLCQTADQCIPPTGSSFTYDCPASHTLCPSSLSYGCCPSGMGCAVNQCYSTEATTITTTMIVTATEDGSRTVYETTATTVKSPDAPTSRVDARDNADQAILKYFPSVIAKVSPTSSASDDDDNGGGGGGLSTGALAGIIAGAVAFLIIVLVAAFIIIRHLNKVIAAVGNSRQSDSSKSRPPMKEFKPTDSEVDAFSVDPLMASPRPTAARLDSTTNPRHGMGSPDSSSRDPTPSVSGAGGYQSVTESVTNSRHTSFDVATGRGYPDGSGMPGRFSQQSGVTAPSTMNRVSHDSKGTYVHLRQWSNGSDNSDGQQLAGSWNQTPLGELEATPYVPELSNSESTVGSPRDDQGRSGGSSPGIMTRPPLVHQRRRSDQQRARSDSLGIVSEEMHGFHGPPNHLVGQTDSHRPGTRGSGGSATKDQREGDGELALGLTP